MGGDGSPELRVVTVGVQERVRQPGLVELGVGERVLQLPMEGLASETEYPTRHRDGDPVRAELAHEQVHHLLGMDA